MGQQMLGRVLPGLASVAGFKPCFMYLFMCVLQWISIYEIHFGSRGYSCCIAIILSFICRHAFLDLAHAVGTSLLLHFSIMSIQVSFLFLLVAFSGRSRA